MNSVIEKYNKIEIRYDELDDLYLATDLPFLLAIDWDGVKFEFLVRLKEAASNLWVFGSGAMEPHGSGPPHFQRHSWMDDIEESIIYYNDPTLYVGPMLLGWGQGTRDRFYLQDIATIVAKLMEKVNMQPKDVVFYGSSGGGFMSLILAGYLRGTTAVVNCPQTCVTKRLERPVQNVFRYAYPGLSVREVLETFPDRVNVMRFYNRINYVPRTYYLQNAACEFDMENHLLPFLAELRSMEDGSVVNHVTVDLYYDKQQGPPSFPALGGHGALGKAETIEYIHRVMSR